MAQWHRLHLLPSMEKTNESLFEWKAPSSQFWQRLAMASITSLTIHVLCFYLFQVQEPKARRTLPQTLSAVALTLDQPAARTILRQLEDYHSAYSGTLLAGSTLEMPFPSLDYESTYQTASVQLMPLPKPESFRPAARDVLAVSPLMLPKIPAWTPPEGSVEQAQEPSGFLKLAEGLTLKLPAVWQGRAEPREGSDVDWAALRGALIAESGRSLWRIAIDSTGAVSKIFPLSEPPRQEVKAAVKTLTFSPPQGNETHWFKVEVLWGESDVAEP
jgi:hypothetical protein